MGLGLSTLCATLPCPPTLSVLMFLCMGLITDPHHYSVAPHARALAYVCQHHGLQNQLCMSAWSIVHEDKCMSCGKVAWDKARQFGAGSVNRHLL